jgi:hypothetical protein
MWHRAGIVKTDVSQEGIASIIRVERNSELGTALAVTTQKNVAFFEVTRCGSCINLRFGETCRFHYQDGKKQRAWNSVNIIRLKNAVFWDVVPCESCKNRCFGETYRFHHQDGDN